MPHLLNILIFLFVFLCGGAVCSPPSTSCTLSSQCTYPCFTGSCISGWCAWNQNADYTPCNMTSQPCAINPYCISGVCSLNPSQGQGGLLNCDDGNTCTNDICYVSNMTCSHTNIGLGVTCNDGNPCTLNDYCDGSGNCLPGSNACGSGTQCTTYTCTPTQYGNYTCSPYYLSGSCNDQKACTYNDVCSLGTCAGTPSTCDDGIATTIDWCDATGTGNCYHNWTATEMRGFGSFTWEGSSTANAMATFNTQSTATPIIAYGLEGKYLKQLDCRKYFSLAVTTDNLMYGSGDASVGELGSVSSNTLNFTKMNLPSLPATPSAVIVGVGDQFAVSLFKFASYNASIWTWGTNAKRQLGQPASVPFNAVPTQLTVPGCPAAFPGSSKLYDLIQVDAAVQHAIAISGYAIWTWGQNDKAQLGLGVPGPVLTPTMLTNPPGVVSLTGILLDPYIGVSAGLKGNLAWTTSGVVFAWGKNSDGELGLGDNFEHDYPTKITFFSSNSIWVAAASLMNSYSLFLSTLGNVYVCGTGGSAMGGISTTYTPTSISFSTAMTGISAGYTHSFFWNANQIYWAGNIAGVITALTPTLFTNYNTSISSFSVTAGCVGQSFGVIGIGPP